MNTRLMATLLGETSRTYRSAFFAIATLGAASSMHTQAEGSQDIQQAIADSSVDFNFRYRFEQVDQDNIHENAGASTLRSRIKWQTPKTYAFKALLELDDVRVIGAEQYNSTANSQSQYPVVADPEGSEVNQAFISYNNDSLGAILGRQRINLDDQRFVGGVGWRQNEQTFDGTRLQYHHDALTFDYSYITQVNRIFGPEGPKAKLEGDIHLLNSRFKISDQQALVGFIYSLDFDDASALSLASQTYGIRYTGQHGGMKLLASIAHQSDTGDNPIDYQANFASVELSGKFSNKVNWKAGYEILGSDDGKQSFVTPLATLHKFQGFSDAFLATPASGVKDAYLGLGFKAGPTNLKLVYHDFQADEGGASLGSEWDAVAIYPVTKKIKALAKFASYDADTHGIDTKKVWLMLQIAI